MTDTMKWVEGQTNRALKSEHEVGVARVRTLEQGFRFHPERWKNWDNYIAIMYALTKAKDDELILDAGACRDPKSPSAFLPTLAEQRCTNLYGMNLDEKGNEWENGVCYIKGNIEELDTFLPGTVAFIACLSTIEHGVDTTKFIQSASRALRRGGHLFVSFDYWNSKIDTGGREAFGVPVKIFSHIDVVDMQTVAFDADMSLTSPWHGECHDPVVKWLGLEYTFANLLWRKR